LLFNFDLEYAIRKIQEKQMGIKSNGKHTLLVYADDVNLLGDNIQSVSNIFVPGSGGYVACPRLAAGSQPTY
jgi:hypothetical protein